MSRSKKKDMINVTTIINSKGKGLLKHKLGEAKETSIIKRGK